MKHQGIVKLLLQHNADVNQRVMLEEDEFDGETENHDHTQREEHTPLSYAIKRVDFSRRRIGYDTKDSSLEDFRMVDLILQLGGDPNSTLKFSLHSKDPFHQVTPL